MILRRRGQAQGEVSLEGLLAELSEEGREAPPPFSPEILGFCSELSSALFADPVARTFPEAQALAFWLRPAELKRLQTRFEALCGEDMLLAPRGLVFHVAPGNVGTIFVYSWLFALLTGNSSVIRLPSGESPAMEALLSVLGAQLRRKEFSRIHRSVWLVSYGHEDEITAALSLKAAVRVIWGGDATVAKLRSFPIHPAAKDLSFPDRYSLCALKTEAYLLLGERERLVLAEKFFNDIYWFEQQACSSPRLVAWCGSRADARTAGDRFYESLRRAVESNGYRLEASSVLRKMTFAHAAAIDEPIAGYRRYGNELTVLQLERLPGLSRRHCGAGLLYDARLDSLEDLSGFIAREDQTLTHFGFSKDELKEFARSLRGRGLTRLVPFGEALRFHRYWDGYDLLQEMTQRVHVQG